MRAENPQSFFNVEVGPKASYRTVICPALDSVCAGEAPIAAADIIMPAKRTYRFIAWLPIRPTAHVNPCAAPQNSNRFLKAEKCAPLIHVSDPSL